MKKIKLQGYKMIELPDIEYAAHKDKKKGFAYMTLVKKKTRYIHIEFIWGKLGERKKRYIRPEDFIKTLAKYLKETKEEPIKELAKQELSKFM